jgi:16S rRNA (guanine527-N7)-methyltransferase
MNNAGPQLSNALLEELRRGAEALGIPLGAQQLTDFATYGEILTQWASRLNLTRLAAPEEIVYRHFLDSLTCLFADRFPEGARVIDVGSGAGFPGVPIKIPRPDLSLTLLDASSKRVAFLEILIDRLKITAEMVHARAEDEARKSIRREAYDRVVSRATAPLPHLLRLCLPFLRVGGRGVFPKGPRAAEELAMADEILSVHKAMIVSVVRVPETVLSPVGAKKPREGYVVVIEKPAGGVARKPTQA